MSSALRSRSIGTTARKVDIEATRAALEPDSFDRAWAEGVRDDARRRGRVRARTRGDRGRPAFGWDSLTPTESKVADLVVDGLTNREIGDDR